MIKKMKCIFKGVHKIGNKTFECGKTYPYNKFVASHTLPGDIPMFTVFEQEEDKDETEKEQNRLDAIKERKDKRDEELEKMTKAKVKAIKDEKAIKSDENKKKIKQAKENTENGHDEFGPLPDTEEWEELSGGKKAAITRKRNKAAKTLADKID